MKKQLLGKISGLTMVATIAVSSVSVYASDEIFKGINPQKSISTKFIFNKNDVNLTESQINELSELKKERIKLKNQLLEKEYEFGLINKDHYEAMKDTTNSDTVMFIEVDDERVFMSQKVFEKNENIENLETSLQKAGELVKHTEDIMELRKERIDLLTEDKKNELTNLMGKSLELEFKILEKQYEFNLIEKDMFDNLSNGKSVTSLYYAQ